MKYIILMTHHNLLFVFNKFIKKIIFKIYLLHVLQETEQETQF